MLEVDGVDEITDGDEIGKIYTFDVHELEID